jgi:hypothetical protein
LNIFFCCIENNEKGALFGALLFLTNYLPFGLALSVPADFLPEAGVAFLALAFVAIFSVVSAPAIGVGLSPFSTIELPIVLEQIYILFLFNLI